MKKIYLSFLFFGGVSVCQSQIIEIPDNYFKAQLLNGQATKDQDGNSIQIDINDDNEISQEEALLAYGLEFTASPYNVSNLTGLSFFTNLRVFQAYQHNISSVNLSTLTNLRELDLRSNSIASINFTGLNQLQKIKLNGNNLNSLNVSMLSALLELEFSDNNVSTLTLPTVSVLERLDFYNNNVTSLDLTGHPNLKYIRCASNDISTLNVTGLTQLTEFYCGDNNLTAIDLSTLTSLSSFGCNNNNITTLDFSMFSDFDYINCDGNQLTTLFLPGNLNTLSCESNELTVLNVAPLSNLSALLCSNNQISVLDVANLTNLTTLMCSRNLLTTLDLSQLVNLNYLYYGNPGLAQVDISTLTQLTSLQIFGPQSNQELNFPNLTIFTAISTDFTEIDLSQCPLLQNIYIYDNLQLEYMNVKNGGNVDSAYISQDPNLSYVCANEGNISYIQNQINYYMPDNSTEVNSYCAFTPGGPFNTISGTARFDYDLDGCEATDPACDFLKVNITDGTATGATFTHGGGNYNYSVQQPNITLSATLENPDYFTVTPPTVSLAFLQNDGSLQTQDFCITPNGIHPDLEVTVLPLGEVRPGIIVQYLIICKNKGNQILSGSVNFTFNDLYADFTSAAPTADAQTYDSVSWNFADLYPFGTTSYTVSITIHTPTDPEPVIGGETLMTNASAIYAGTDETPADNSFSMNQIVVNSFDPNDKTCLEGNMIAPDMIGEYVHYMIRFENTGTASAQNIVVKDTIDISKFAIASLVPIHGSHSFKTLISSGNKVEFIFENINLPFDDGNNDGYVAFKIRTLPPLEVGDTFENSASIYFDFNLPIVTNTASTTIQLLNSVDFDFDRYFAIYPNPASDNLNIHVAEGILPKSLAVYNQLGQMIYVTTGWQPAIDISQFSDGTYFIRVETDKGSSVKAFIAN